MDFSGRIQIVYGLEGELTDAWRAAWRDYKWDAVDGRHNPLRPQLRVTEQGAELCFDWQEGFLEGDLDDVFTAIEACNHGLRNARAVEELHQRAD